MKKTVIFLFIGYLFLSCAGKQKQGQISYGKGRVVEAPYERLFRATRDYFDERGYHVIRTDYETGIIETDFRYANWDRRAVERREKLSAKVTKIDEITSELAISLFTEARDMKTDASFSLIRKKRKEKK